ncbi:MAG: PIG-L family deacetylase [Kiritimatiellae bacterium]|nr:PIG-L family deacetylase [Kiritimatiellia bacterium]
MKLSKPEATLFIPDGLPEPEALSRTTHLAVGAHQDDIEFMAFHGILTCYRQAGKRFAGITCTNGAGSPRAGVYTDCSDADMMAIRRGEQNEAARIGHYGFMAQLAYTSKELKDPVNPAPVNDLEALLRSSRPEVVYTHNPADKHDTHVAVMLALIEALRRLPKTQRPQRLLGCEVWRDLDWMPDADKVALDVSGRDHLAMSLMGVFDSQIAGGKRYDLATMGRRRAHATYAESHGVDKVELLTYAMDLSPLLADDSLDVGAYVADLIRRFEGDVRQRLALRHR